MKKQVVPIHPYQDIKSIVSAGQCLSWWLVHAFLYYRMNNPIISDKDFDTLTNWLKMSWQHITHQHKHLVTMEDLNAGSGYAVNFPLMVEHSAYHVLREIEQKMPLKTLAKKSPSVKTKSDSTHLEYDTLFG